MTDFERANRAALMVFPAVLARILPGGKVLAGEYTVLNPRRNDKRLGSFKIRLTGSRAGFWADFATGEKGGDPVSLIAYVANVNQGQAARILARMLGLETTGAHHG
jgi:hypothetical protein